MDFDGVELDFRTSLVKLLFPDVWVEWCLIKKYSFNMASCSGENTIHDRTISLGRSTPDFCDVCDICVSDRMLLNDTLFEFEARSMRVTKKLITQIDNKITKTMSMMTPQKYKRIKEAHKDIRLVIWDQLFS